jgi:tellurite resistance protein
MTEKDKKGHHPIVEKVLNLAYKGFEPVEFDDYAVEQIQDMLRERFGKPDLLQAVVDLINLASVLEDQGSPAAAMKLIIAVSIASDGLKDKKEKDSE